MQNNETEFKDLRSALPEAICLVGPHGERFILTIHHESLMRLVASAKMNKSRRATLGALAVHYKGGR